MKPRFIAFVCLTLFFSAPMQAHVGSPDVFYDGMVGPWPARITIRMPGVVPGRAEILVQVQAQEPVSVSFVPLASGIAVSNAPPPETAQPVRGETNIYTGELWLMTTGAYSIDVRLRGKSGEGAVQIPVDSIARTQLPLPPLLGQMLLVLGLILFCSAIVIIAAAAGESTLPPDVLPGKTERRKYWTAATTTGVVLALALVGGKKWWNAEENDFRSRLREGGWPDLAADVRVEGAQRILGLTLGGKSPGAQEPNDALALEPDHGKLLHLFLVGQPNHQVFAHLHPVRQGNNTFEVALPPLPAGDYEMFCDLTLDSGLSSTATNTVHLPPMAARPAKASATNSLEPDPDDSWAIDSAVAVRENSGGEAFCRLPGGTQIVWNAHPPLRANQDAALQFQVLDQAGQPAHLEPYMGMMSHAAVLRSDGGVFAHLHPSGNYSMAAQMFFESKMATEAGGAKSEGARNLSKWDEWCGPPPAGGGSSIISLPYEFPTAGNYRVWVQIKTNGRVETGIFDATVM
jgi:hypothetical protein